MNEFPFPSNGKYFPNYLWTTTESYSTVSIPFKREILSEQKTKDIIQVIEALFPFPSNGKYFPNAIKETTDPSWQCFHSLQTGNTFRTQYLTVTNDFHSLQTGIILPDVISLNVSIPFKREILSEQHPLRTQSQ